MANIAVSPNAAQSEYWNAAAGETWAKLQELLDRQIEPLGLAAIDVLQPGEGEHIIDIGCGCGQSSLALAACVAPTGSVLGIDLSKPMLEVARHRPRPAANLRVDFRQLDAQTGDIGRGIFDAAFSRFGVMFFSDPVAAFRNIRASLKRGGRLVFVCWRPLAENPWMLAPLQAALPFIPPVAPPDPTAPGPFAFADAGRVRSILSDAGFASVTTEPFDARIGGSDLEQSLKLALRLGPLGAALREHPELSGKVAGAVRDLLSRYLTAGGVLVPSAVWIVRAQNP
ncbi:MAG: class I SAM-dependent methyltransferase [Xanthobacteraceae bacterium]|jgi:SAM-dependent methyltransferase